MVVFCVVKGRRGDEFCDDWAFIELCLVELRDVGRGDFLLFFGGVKDCRAILRADVRALAILLRGIMNDAEENHQKLAVSDARGIVDDADAFGVAGRAGADEVVVRIFDVAAAVARDDFFHANDVFIDGLRAPEAASCEDGNLFGGFFGQSCINCRRR